MLHSFRHNGTSLWRPALLALSVTALVAATASAQNTSFRTLAGMSPAGDGNGTGTEARFNAPTAIAVDGSGNLFVVDQQNCQIRKVTSAGVVEDFAGSPNCGAANGNGEAAQFNFPTGIAIDGAGQLYVADTNSHTIRKISPAGVVTTLAGQPFQFGTTDGTGNAARFNRPVAVAVDGAGTVYVADSNNHAIRQVTPAGVVTTLAGTAASSGYIEGPVASAKFNRPSGIAVDGGGNIYVADSNNQAIRKIAAGMVSTLAGGAFGSQDGTGSAARFNGPRQLAIDGAGNLYVADIGNQRIRQVTTSGGVVTTVSGSFRQGGNDGPAANARFNNPEGVAVNAAGAVYVADTSNDSIRKIASGVVTTLAGFVGSFGSADGQEQLARFGIPWGVAVDSHGTLYVADRNNSTIRKVTRTGVVTTLAGLADNPGNVDGTGSAARFGSPSGVAVDSGGTVYVFDTGWGTIRKITPDGVVTTLAGDGTYGSNDGTGSGARFGSQGGIAVDSATGLIYVADTLNNKIRRVTLAGVVTTIAGTGVGGHDDGAGGVATFFGPRALAVDASGNVYIADSGNHTIRIMTPAGVVSTIAGVALSPGGNDGPGTGTNPARFSSPQGIAVDNAGAVYVADTNNHIIRRIAGNVVTRLAGCTGCFGGENFGRFNQPVGMAVDARGFLYVGDSRNNSIRTTAPLPTGLAVDFGPAYGIWLRRDTVWRQVHAYTAEAMLSISDGDQDALIIDFGPGIGVWFYGREGDGSEFWFQIHSQSPDAMVGLDLDGDGEVETGVFSFPGQGLWLFDGDNGTWTKLHVQNPSHMVAANIDGLGGDELVIDFPGYGLWIYANGSWTSLHPSDVSLMTAADLDGNGKKDVIANFPNYGVWAYMNGTTWTFIHPYPAKRLASGDLDGNGVPELIVDFGTGIGVWVRRTATTWNQLHIASPENIVAGDLDGDGHDEMLADFGASGIWSYQDGPGWTFVHAFNPTGMATGRLR